jgi:hypothetical protein
MDPTGTHLMSIAGVKQNLVSETILPITQVHPAPTCTRFIIFFFKDIHIK